MADSFLDNAGGFTPLSHILAQEVGLVCAAVYGVVWRYCQMEEGACRASLDTLGSDINIDRATVMRSIKKLCELGYLIDQTPGRRNAPHTYTLSKSVAECNSNTVVMRNSPEDAEGESVAHNNSSMESVAESKATVAESHLKKDSKKPLKETTTKEKTPPKGGGKPPIANQESRAMFSALAETCGLEIKLLTDENRGALNQAEKIMRDNGYKPADLSAFSGWWHAHDWRGKQGDDPTLAQIRETWGRFRKWQQGNIPANADPILPPLPPLSADEATWAEAMTIIQGSVTHATFDQLIKPLKPAGDSNGTFILLSPAELDPRLLKKIEPALIQVDHNIKKVEVHQNDP